MDVKIYSEMIRFKEYLEFEITEEEINDLIESLEWEDVIELFEEKDMVLDEAISTTERLKRGNRIRSRKTMIATSKHIKLSRAANLDVLKRRAKVAARKILQKKFLKGRTKRQLSASERNFLEARISAALAAMKNYPERLMPKIRSIEHKRLTTKRK
jgi:hypothetical protein